MIIEFLKEEKCNEMFNLIKDCFNLEVNNNIKEIIKSENCKEKAERSKWKKQKNQQKINQ